MTLGTTELSLIDRWQRDFPLTERPFALVADASGLDEAEAIEKFIRLQETGVISRIGAVVKPNTVGASTLAALRVPPERLAGVAEIVSREPLVNHNYERTHAINLWFVIAGPDPESITTTVRRIEEQTALAVLSLPLLQAYHIDLGFPLAGDRARDRGSCAAAGRQPDSLDRTLLATIEDGLPLVVRPYHSIAERLGLEEDDVLDRLRRLTLSGVVKRFGCVVRHRTLGYEANAMAVWDIADENVDDVADLFASNPNVTLCYRRPRRLPDWPYNLFCMVHAKSRSEAFAAIDDLNLVAATGLNRQAVLFSTRCFKQRGATFSNPARGTA
jgi:DNA-binding Lrp family transcriptional regulator